MERMIEVCAGSYQDCIAAHQGSAKRVELNSALCWWLNAKCRKSNSC